MVEGPGIPPVRICLERNAQVWKGSVQLPGRKKPLRHLVGISEELTGAAPNPTRTLLADATPEFVWSSLAQTHGLPGMAEWAAWFHEQLERHRAIMPILGIGCEPVLVKGNKEQFLAWLGRGVQSNEIVIPPESGSIRWPRTSLRQIFSYPAA
jgi:hypothetical protein